MTAHTVRLFVISAVLAALGSTAFAADYPVPGRMTPEYTTLFRLIDRGECDRMQPLVDLLEKRTGADLSIYAALCYVNANRIPEAYRAVKELVDNQQYDEADYVLDYIGERGVDEPLFLKYRGLVAYNVGDLDAALENLERYITIREDRDAVFIVADILINRNDLAEADNVLDTLPLDDDKKRYRKGVIAMKRGELRNAYTLLRSVSQTAVGSVIYAQAQTYIAEMCYAERRLRCALERYDDILSLDLPAFNEAAKTRKRLIRDDRVAMSGMLILGMQYDTNVTAAPDDEIYGISDESSLRNYGVLDVSLNLFAGPYDHMEIGMFNYGAKNRDVEGYDMHNHVGYFRGTWKKDDYNLTVPVIRHGVTYLDSDLFLTRTDVGGTLTLKYDRGIIEFPTLVTKKTYDDGLTGVYDRDSLGVSFGTRGVRRFGGGHQVTLSGFAATEEAEGDPQSNYRYDATFRLSLHLSRHLTLRFYTDGTYYDYHETSRIDRYLDTGLFLDIKPLNRVALRIGGRYVVNASDVNFYDYKKSVFDFSLSTYF